MDRPISQSIQNQAKRKRYVQAGTALLALLAFAYFMYNHFAISADRSLLRTAKVELGEVVASVNATGTIVPEFEQTITSPIDTRILKVMRRAGDSLRQGEPIMMLDVDQVRISIRKSYDQLALKSNALAQLKATYESQLIKLRSQQKNKQLELARKQDLYEQDATLLKGSMISKNEYLQSKLVYEQTQNEYEEATASLQSLAASVALQEEGLKLEISILRSELHLLEQQMAQADTRVNRAGILTWVLNTEGASIQKGGVIARIADLSAYRLDVKVSEIHAASISVGMPVQFKISRAGQEILLDGEVSNISPSIENGIMTVQAKIAEANHPALRPNQRVDVYLISERKEQVLRLRRPSFASTEGKTEVFVIRGEKAVKTLVEIGIRSTEMVEIRAGLQVGDEVIVSDMNDYKHASSILLK
jgi:HlyD family secretion protein